MPYDGQEYALPPSEISYLRGGEPSEAQPCACYFECRVSAIGPDRLLIMCAWCKEDYSETKDQFQENNTSMQTTYIITKVTFEDIGELSTSELKSHIALQIAKTFAPDKQKIQAIKLFRKITGCGLKESKHYIDAYMDDRFYRAVDAIKDASNEREVQHSAPGLDKTDDVPF